VCVQLEDRDQLVSKLKLEVTELARKLAVKEHEVAIHQQDISSLQDKNRQLDKEVSTRQEKS
jgi:FtsZ-binding cell division protein ZapB